MRDMNKVILVGRLGADPILRSTQTGQPVANFSLATETYSKDKQESETTWHRVVAWGKQAEFCQQQLHKGTPLFVEGRMKTKKWEDNGTTRYMTEVHVDNVLPLQPRMKSVEQPAEAEVVN